MRLDLVNVETLFVKKVNMNKITVEFSNITPNEVERMMAGLSERGYDATIVEGPISHPDNDSMTGPDEKKLLTLPEYIKEHGWPSHDDYAYVNSNGKSAYTRFEPVFRDITCSSVYMWEYTGGGFHDSTQVILKVPKDPKDSLVKKCDRCKGSGIVSATTGVNVGIATCAACNGTKIKPKSTKIELQKNSDVTHCCANCNKRNHCTYVRDGGSCGSWELWVDGKPKQDIPCPECVTNQESSCKCEPKLKSLSDEPWPDPNEGWLVRRVDEQCRAVVYCKEETPIAGWTSLSGMLNTHEFSNEIQKHPRYDDILWLRKWKGKKITKVNPQVTCVVAGLYKLVAGKFYDFEGVCHNINENWTEAKEPKRVPLTAKDYRNIRAIRRTCWGEDLERRFTEITKEGILVAGCLMTFEYLYRSQKDDAWEGITFDNKIVPLYKEEK
jgi:hypothetical protein